MELTSFETAIKNFLDKYIQEDPDPDFIDKYKNNPKKSISECCKYIMKEVEKARKNGEKCVAVSDDEVFGMAIHYFDEDDLVVEEPKATVHVQAPEQASEEAVSKTKTKTRKPKAKKEKPVEVTAEIEELDINIPEPLDIPLF